MKKEPHLGREVFRHAGLLNEGPPGFLQSSGVVREQPGCFDLRRYVGNLVLHALRIQDFRDKSTKRTIPQNRIHHRETESIWEAHLEVKDALPELAPLSGVRNCVVKAPLRKAEHLKATAVRVSARGPIVVSKEVSFQRI